MSPAGNIVWIMVTVLACYAGCGEKDPGEEGVRKAFETLFHSLQNADADALWDLSDVSTQLYFDKLAGEIRTVRNLVNEHYPDPRREEALRALGGHHFEQAATGRALFKALIDPGKLVAPEDPAAQEVDRVVVGAYTATVITGSGRSVEFSLDEKGAFRTGVFMEAFLKQPALSTLRDNITTARQNCAVYSRAGDGKPTGEGP